MAELAALNVRLTGDSANLRSALQSAEDGLENLSAQAQKTVRQTTLATGSMGRLGSVFQRNSFAISNAANQFSDLAVQIGAGTPAARALSQQLPQMTAMMGPLATVIGVASGVLIGLAGNFLSARDNASGFQDALDDLRDSSQSLRDEIFMLTQGLDNLAQADTLREIQTGLQNIAEMEERLARLEDTRGQSAVRQARQLREALQAERERVAGLQEQLIENQRLSQELRDQKDEAQRIKEFVDMITAAIDNASDAADRLTGRFTAAAAAAAGIFRPGLGFQLGATSSDRNMSPFQLGTPIGGGTGLPDVPGAGGGAAPVNPLIAQIEQLEQSLMTQEQLEIDSFQRRQQILEDALRQQLLTRQEYANLMEQVEASHQFAMTQQTNQGVSQALGALGNLFQGSKKIGAGVALANSWLAFTEVLKDPSFVGRPFARFAAAASALGAGLNAVRNIRSASTGGGAVSGGAATAGAVSGGATGGGVSRNVAISLTGGDMFSRSQVINLINSINEAVEDGAIVRLV